MLTIHTAIPTNARGKVRALIKAHSDWHAFLERKGLISASAKNRDLIEFALAHPALAGQVWQLVCEAVAPPLMTLARYRELNGRTIPEHVAEAEALLQRLATPPKLRIRVKAKTVSV